MDRTVQDTFNAFWSLQFGKNAKDVDLRILRFLCRLGESKVCKQAMIDIIEGFKPWLEKEDEFQQNDWEQMSDVANSIHKKYIYNDEVFPVIAEVYMYIDRRETKKHEINNRDT